MNRADRDLGMGRIPEDEEVGSRGIVSRRTNDVYTDRSVKKEKSEILSKNDVSGTKNTRDDTTQDSLPKNKRGGGGSRSSRKRASKTRNLRRKSIKRHRRRTSRK